MWMVHGVDDDWRPYIWSCCARFLKKYSKIMKESVARKHEWILHWKNITWIRDSPLKKHYNCSQNLFRCYSLKSAMHNCTLMSIRFWHIFANSSFHLPDYNLARFAESWGIQPPLVPLNTQVFIDPHSISQKYTSDLPHLVLPKIEYCTWRTTFLK